METGIGGGNPCRRQGESEYVCLLETRRKQDYTADSWIFREDISMKAVKCLFIILVLGVSAGMVQAVNILNPDFEGDGLGAAEWADDTTPSGWTWNSSESRGIGNEASGNHYFWHGNASVLYQTTNQVITAAGVSYTLQVDVRDDWESLPQITLYYDNADTRVALGSAVGSGADDVWETVELTVSTTAASVGKNIGVALSQSGGTGWAWFDNVSLKVNTVTLVSPDNGAEYVSLNPTLSWSAVGTVEYIDLFMGIEDDPNLTTDPLGRGYQKLSMEPASTTSWQVGPLAYETTYYWEVIAYEPNSLGSGYVATASGSYHFKTTGPQPHLSTQPQPQTVAGDGSQSPSMAVSGTEISHYEWYEQTLGQLTEGAKYTGVDTAVLTIHNAAFTDEGLYYCKVWNDQSPVVLDSEPAVLITKRLAGWWKFENNLDDSVNEDPTVIGAAEHPGTTSDPNYTDGIDGFSKMFSPGSELLVIQDSRDFFNFYVNGYTISAWVRTTAPGDTWPPFAGKETGSSGEGFMLSADTSTGNAVHILRGASYQADGNQYGTTAVNNDQWHMITGVYDADSGLVLIYVDGRFETENANTNPPAVNLNDLVFGAWGGEMLTQYSGDLDDVRIWSYPLSAREIATVYTDLKPADPVCVPEPKFDVAGPAGDDVPDCKVDLYDLAVLAGQEWLSCNWLPTSLCP